MSVGVCLIEGPHALAIGILNNHHAVLSRSLTDALSVARSLNDEEVLSDAALSSVTSTKGSTERRKVLLAAIEEAVKTNYCFLQTFATVLTKFTANVSLGEAIHRDYGESYCAVHLHVSSIERLYGTSKSITHITVETQGNYRLHCVFTVHCIADTPDHEMSHSPSRGPPTPNGM